MNTKSSILTMIVIAIIAIGASILFKPTVNVGVSPTPITVNVPDQKTPVVNVNPEVRAPNVNVNVPQTKTFGAVPTLDGVDNPFTSIGGVRTYYYSQGMAATSSVVCSIKNPYQATSTILQYSAQVRVNGIGTNLNIYLSTSTTQHGGATAGLGSSTPELVRAFPTGTGQFSMFWFPNATTTGTLDNDTASGASYVLLGPSEYLNLKLGTSSPGTFSSYYTGKCDGIIRALAY